jgi:hypothetical protein
MWNNTATAERAQIFASQFAPTKPLFSLFERTATLLLQFSFDETSKPSSMQRSTKMDAVNANRMHMVCASPDLRLSELANKQKKIPRKAAAKINQDGLPRPSILANTRSKTAPYQLSTATTRANVSDLSKPC